MNFKSKLKKNNKNTTKYEKKAQFNIQDLKLLFKNSADIQFENIGKGLHIIYCSGLIDQKLFNQNLIPNLEILKNKAEELTSHQIIEEWKGNIQKIASMKTMETNIFSGEVILFVEKFKEAFSVPIANPPHRNTEEPNTERAILGARDGFTEELSINVSLIRKRIRSKSLSYEKFTIGTRSNTKIGLLYINDIINPKILNEIKDRIDNITQNIDVIDSTQQLSDLLSESSYSIFPVFDYSQHPDYVSNALRKGRFVILVENVPTAMIAPFNLFITFKSSADNFNPFLPASFAILLRAVGFSIAILLPGFWIALTTYHSDQIPLSLLATLTMSRKGVPFPTPIEALLMALIFELFREAGARLPIANGQTIGVVGGIIIGDAAINSGLTDPSIVVVVATSAVAAFTLIHPSIIGVVSILRLYTIILSSFVGMFGFFMAMFTVLIYLSGLRSFGIPYLTPISPFIPKEAIRTFFKIPFSEEKNRPSFLKPNDSSSKEDES